MLIFHWKLLYPQSTTTSPESISHKRKREKEKRERIKDKAKERVNSLLCSFLPTKVSKKVFFFKKGWNLSPKRAYNQELKFPSLYFLLLVVSRVFSSEIHWKNTIFCSEVWVFLCFFQFSHRLSYLQDKLGYISVYIFIYGERDIGGVVGD